MVSPVRVEGHEITVSNAHLCRVRNDEYVSGPTRVRLNDVD